MTAERAPGYPQISPYLCVDGAAEAVAFYEAVFDATERLRIPAPDGKVGHSELEIGDGLVMVSDEWPDMNVLGPKSIGGTPIALNVYVDDADAAMARAVEHGATQLRPVEDHFYGDRAGQFEDPWGHRWNVAHHVENVAPDEVLRRARELFGD